MVRIEYYTDYEEGYDEDDYESNWEIRWRYWGNSGYIKAIPCKELIRRMSDISWYEKEAMLREVKDSHLCPDAETIYEDLYMEVYPKKSVYDGDPPELVTSFLTRYFDPKADPYVDHGY